MDTTELHYLDYDPEEIWSEMMVAYVEAGGDILYPGDEKEMLLRAVQAIVVQMFSGVDNALRMQTLRYAVGEYLDIIGELHGCTRLPATKTRFMVDITTNSDFEGTILLPAGTEMTFDGKDIFTTLENVYIYKDFYFGVSVEAKEAGKTNLPDTTTQLSLLEPNPAVNSITRIGVAIEGNDIETDEDYRERIRTYGFASVTAGPAMQYENIAKSVDAAVLDAKALNGGAGKVNVYIVAGGQEGYFYYLKDKILEKLSAQDVRPLTDTVDVKEGQKLTYEITLMYKKSSVMTDDAIDRAIAEYHKNQDNKLGKAFDPNMLLAAVYQAGAERAMIGTGSTFNGSAAAYTQISDTQYCSGVINKGEIL